MGKVKCPFFKRRVSSYIFYGISCTATFEQGQTMGDIVKWEKDYREKFISEHCNGDYEKCPHYKQNQERGGRM
jgi:hypothetical protein